MSMTVAGQRAVERNVLKRHMRAAVERRRDAGIAADDGDIVLGIAAGKERLVVAATGGKGAEGVDDGLEAGGGKAAGHADHVGLRDAAVDGAVGVGDAPFCRADTVHQVRVQIDDVGILRGQRGDDLAHDRLDQARVHFAVINDIHSLSPPKRSAPRAAGQSTFQTARRRRGCCGSWRSPRSHGCPRP